jgi:hypothetical protein
LPSRSCAGARVRLRPAGFGATAFSALAQRRLVVDAVGSEPVSARLYAKAGFWRFFGIALWPVLAAGRAEISQFSGTCVDWRARRRRNCATVTGGYQEAIRREQAGARGQMPRASRVRLKPARNRRGRTTPKSRAFSASFNSPATIGPSTGFARMWTSPRSAPTTTPRSGC